jgi:hypothetical protein
MTPATIKTLTQLVTLAQEAQVVAAARRRDNLFTQAQEAQAAAAADQRAARTVALLTQLVDQLGYGAQEAAMRARHTEREAEHLLTLVNGVRDTLETAGRS